MPVNNTTGKGGIRAGVPAPQWAQIVVSGLTRRSHARQCVTWRSCSRHHCPDKCMSRRNHKASVSRISLSLNRAAGPNSNIGRVSPGGKPAQGEPHRRRSGPFFSAGGCCGARKTWAENMDLTPWRRTNRGSRQEPKRGPGNRPFGLPSPRIRATREDCLEGAGAVRPQPTRFPTGQRRCRRPLRPRRRPGRQSDVRGSSRAAGHAPGAATPGPPWSRSGGPAPG